jgi:diguanylate cyclase (GGDEF)-like protein
VRQVIHTGLLLPSEIADNKVMLRHRRQDGRFNRRSLVVRFALVSGALTALFGMLLTFWLTSFVRDTNVAHARDSATYSLQLSLGNANQSTSKSRGVGFTAAQFAATTTFLKAMVATGKYVGATAWLPGNVITIALEPGRAGTAEQPRPQLARAFAGQLVSVVISKPMAGVPDVTERAALKKVGPVLETFAPVRINGAVLAVVVLYQPWAPVQKQIDTQTMEMLLLVGGGLAVLWLGLMGFVVSANRQLRVRNQANWQLASHDSLTGLPNRKLIGERVEQALAATRRSGGNVGLMLIDLDDFKAINDTLGHHAGDALLTQIGPRLSAAPRDADSVGRLGGDEFVVLLPNLADAAEATSAANRVNAAFAEPFTLESLSLPVQASIGVAVAPVNGDNFSALLRRADVGMYTAKNAGGGVAAYSVRAEAELTAARRARQSLIVLPRGQDAGIGSDL